MTDCPVGAGDRLQGEARQREGGRSCGPTSQKRLLETWESLNSCWWGTRELLGELLLSVS